MRMFSWGFAGIFYSFAATATLEINNSTNPGSSFFNDSVINEDVYVKKYLSRFINNNQINNNIIMDNFLPVKFINYGKINGDISFSSATPETIQLVNNGDINGTVYLSGRATLNQTIYNESDITRIVNVEKSGSAQFNLILDNFQSFNL